MARTMMSNHTDMQDKYCADCYDIHSFKSNIQRWQPLAATKKKVGAAFGRATSLVVSLVLVLNTVNIVAVITILVFHVGVIGHYVPCHSGSCSLAVRAMRLCAQGESVKPCGRGVCGRWCFGSPMISAINLLLFPPQFYSIKSTAPYVWWRREHCL